jgi:multisubunit Na+/H+ antiporter MnhB subunit
LTATLLFYGVRSMFRVRDSSPVLMRTILSALIIQTIFGLALAVSAMSHLTPDIGFLGCSRLLEPHLDFRYGLHFVG